MLPLLPRTKLETIVRAAYRSHEPYLTLKVVPAGRRKVQLGRLTAISLFSSGKLLLHNRVRQQGEPINREI